MKMSFFGSGEMRRDGKRIKTNLFCSLKCHCHQSPMYIFIRQKFQLKNICNPFTRICMPLIDLSLPHKFTNQLHSASTVYERIVQSIRRLLICKQTYFYIRNVGAREVVLVVVVGGRLFQFTRKGRIRSSSHVARV